MKECIPRYQLYGDDRAETDMSFVHCEPMFGHIQDQHWEISAHRHDSLHQIFWVKQGCTEAQVETDNIDFKGPGLLFVPSGKVHGFRYNPAVTGISITISEAMMSRVRSLSPRWPSALLDRIHHVSLESNRVEICIAAENVYNEFRQSHAGRSAAVTAWLCLFFIELGRLNEISPDETLDGEEYPQLFERFHQLLNKNLNRQYPLSKYCDLLGVGERRLHRACKGVVDVSPSVYMQNALIQEAKRLLVYTLMPVTRVCYELGFSSPGYFSRFFKKHAGMAPSEYAKLHRSSSSE